MGASEEEEAKCIILPKIATFFLREKVLPTWKCLAFPKTKSDGAHIRRPNQFYRR